MVYAYLTFISMWESGQYYVISSQKGRLMK